MSDTQKRPTANGGAPADRATIVSQYCTGLRRRRDAARGLPPILLPCGCSRPDALHICPAPPDVDRDRASAPAVLEELRKLYRSRPEGDRLRTTIAEAAALIEASAVVA